MAIHSKPTRPPWWINPFLYCLFFLLPFFLITISVADPYMDGLGQKVDNLTLENILLGCGSIAMFMLGSVVPFSFGRSIPTQRIELSPASVNRALRFMGTLSLVCNVVYFAPLVLHPGVIASFFSGNSIAGARGQQIPGITSFISACLPFFALYGATTIGNAENAVSRYNRRLFKVLFVLTAARAIMGSERLALIEAAVAYGVPRAAFVWRPGRFRILMPLFAVGGVFALFCVGEYFRSWQYYKRSYDSFWDFITVRFFGYFVTSINNGAGLVTYFPPLGIPGHTVGGFYALLRIVGIDYDPAGDMVDNYLNWYATPEFNNSGGLYVPYMDYGIVAGLFVFLLMGVVTSWLYRCFLAGRPIGLLLYPSWFLALLDIIRTWHWGASRLVPVIIVACFVGPTLRTKEKARGDLLK